jgi:hypothetical protein
MNDKDHRTHGVMLGIATAGILTLTRSAEPLTALIAASVVGTASTAYMLKYGHGMPNDDHQVQSSRKPHTIPNPRSVPLRHRASPGTISSVNYRYL